MRIKEELISPPPPTKRRGAALRDKEGSSNRRRHAPDVRRGRDRDGNSATATARRQQRDEFNVAAAVASTPDRMSTPREVAKCVLFLASEDAAYMTRAALAVDGGLSVMYLDDT
ncbi:hypothetical protein F4678DRAFT_457126 [Xylaria arbuscula]|nr:hypothetical protein F4678DRAFT_457126 [Xylaria arbuscula]